MEQKKITKFPAGFFQAKRPTITASEALKDTIPFEWSNETEKNKKKKIVRTNKKTSRFD